MTTIAVQLNDETTVIPGDLSLKELLTHLDYPQQNFAIAINETFVPRSQYSTTKIHADDAIEIVAPMQGG